MKPDNSEPTALAEQLNQVFIRPSGRAVDEIAKSHFKQILLLTQMDQFYVHLEILKLYVRRW